MDRRREKRAYEYVGRGSDGLGMGKEQKGKQGGSIGGLRNNKRKGTPEKRGATARGEKKQLRF